MLIDYRALGLPSVLKKKRHSSFRETTHSLTHYINIQETSLAGPTQPGPSTILGLQRRGWVAATV